MPQHQHPHYYNFFPGLLASRVGPGRGTPLSGRRESGCCPEDLSPLEARRARRTPVPRMAASHALKGTIDTRDEGETLGFLKNKSFTLVARVRLTNGQHIFMLRVWFLNSRVYSTHVS